MMTKEQLAEAEKEILQGMAVSEEDRLWKAVNLALVICLAQEHTAAKGPGLSDADRHYNTGREAGLEDFQHFLQQLFQRARQ